MRLDLLTIWTKDLSRLYPEWLAFHYYLHQPQPYYAGAIGNLWSRKGLADMHLVPPTFESWQSYSEFAFGVKRSKRHARSAKAISFLNTLVLTSASRQTLIPAGTLFWRAQLGFNLSTFHQDVSQYGDATPHLPERMKPLRWATKSGRLNRTGARSSLYLATDQHTAVSETRPWIGNHVSVAQFRIHSDVRVLDCSSEHSEDYQCYEEEPPDFQERERAVWRELSRSLSEPIGAETRTVDYVPTQIIAEHFRAKGWDGILYQSLLGGGKNLALFDLTRATLISCTLQYVRSLVPVYDEVVNPKYLDAHYPSEA